VLLRQGGAVDEKSENCRERQQSVFHFNIPSQLLAVPFLAADRLWSLLYRRWLKGT
jgi:hypothetical protein